MHWLAIKKKEIHNEYKPTTESPNTLVAIGTIANSK